MLNGSIVTTIWRVMWFADGGDGLQLWKVAMNIMNNQ
jgi:hypothetical protein